MNHDEDFKAARAWAQRVLTDDNLIILDTETTGLHDNAEIVQLAIIGGKGEVILDTLIKPLDDIPAAASAIHGIDARRVRHAPYFETVWPVVNEVITGKTLVVYNAAFDMRMLRQCCKRALIPFSLHDLTVAHCAMHWYSAWVGDWHDYHQSYTWQRLPGGDHSALGDCRATLDVLRTMASEE
jgi:DNA polymerase-3 subunit epsilon